MSGGAALHMFDSIDRHPGIQIVSMTHEQCAAIAADGYARASGRLGVAVTTSGPGATNLLTGTCCSYYDSVPTLMLTGQVSTHRLKGAHKVRQLGFQETDVVAIFAPVTKYAVQLSSAMDIRFHLEKAFYLAFEGRPGPVLIDIPDDLQRMEIEPEQLPRFIPDVEPDATVALGNDVSILLETIQHAVRPVLVLGGGLKTPFVGAVLQECIEKLGIPVLVSWAGLDIIAADHPLRIGTFGVYGPRVGNFAVQNADLVVALGTRLSQNLTGGILSSFARVADIVMVDIDEHELNKFDGRGINIQLRIKAKLTDFFAALRPQLDEFRAPDWTQWKAKIEHWRQVFPADASPSADVAYPYIDAGDFVQELSTVLPEEAILYVDTGGNLTWTCNNFMPKRGQSVNSAWNNTPLGYSLPAAIGAAMFNPQLSITCIIGDGGLMLCLAELATVVRHQLPIKILLFNNRSHGIQKQTLETWLGGRKVGVDSHSGLAFPSDWVHLAESLGLRSCSIARKLSIREELAAIYERQGPVFVNIEINPEQKLYPVLKFGESLENQLPFLDQATISAEMLIPAFDNTALATISHQQSTPGV